MFLVRPAAAGDVDALFALAAAATQGVHTLPRSRESIEQAVGHSVASFAADVAQPGDEAYFFVLENGADQSIAGAAAIKATAGASGAYFVFRNDVIQQVSRDLGISHSVDALTLCSDLSSCSQLSSFYVPGAENLPAAAALLSRARLLFAALAPHRFADKFFASLSGSVDAAGRSAFWEALGRKFFNMDFLEAERTIGGARNRTLIVELMPHYPVYVPLLPAEAQAAMGQVHEEGRLPLQLLTREGFARGEFIDIFDGGPILQAHKSLLASFTAARRRVVAGTVTGATTPCLLANLRQTSFRALLADCAAAPADNVALSPALMVQLQVAAGDDVLCVPL